MRTRALDNKVIDHTRIILEGISWELRRDSQTILCLNQDTSYLPPIRARFNQIKSKVLLVKGGMKASQRIRIRTLIVHRF